jgi:hypothetical protein
LQKGDLKPEIAFFISLSNLSGRPKKPTAQAVGVRVRK